MKSTQPPAVGGGRLPEELFRKITAVDQGISTLTQAGCKGLSARILDKEFKDDTVIQFVEIIKKPGQSLGLYLREGNGKDRNEGVFVSRFGESSELARYGDVIRPGDEILSINNVEVSLMGIDDVVLILSIPRRLLLRIRYSKSMRHESPMFMQNVNEKPVVVFHKMEERKDSESLSNVPIMSKPTSTANTWLGKKSREQVAEMRSGTLRSNPPSKVFYPPPRMASDNALRFQSNDASDSIKKTARFPPPRLQSYQVRRTESFNSAPMPSTSDLNMYTLPRSSTSVPPPDPSSLLSRSLCSPLLHRNDQKTNSLPRKRIVGTGTRNVKWRNDVCATDYESDGAISAPEYSNRIYHQRGRTVNDIFSAAEYRNWARPHDVRGLPNRWSHTYGDRASSRASSVPARPILAQSLVGSPVVARHYERPSSVFDKYHVSPLMNRRAPLRAAGPGINVDRLNVSSLTGILFVQILEGRDLKIPERQKGVTEEMYCVLEVDDQHRARTGVSRIDQKFRWRETFHIDVLNSTVANFFVYSWHPQFRHKLCHKGSLKLLEAFIVDQLNGDRVFALNLEPRGQLVVRIGFHDLPTVFRRTVNPCQDAIFGTPLSRILHREGRETPIVLTRLIQEIEKRGVDYNGLYMLCGSMEKKRMLRDELEMNPLGTELSCETIPDSNVIACLIKDFLRELPEPLITPEIHSMLIDAASVAMPNDINSNRSLILRIIDCLPLCSKNCVLLVLDHLVTVLASSPHNGMSQSKISLIFAPLLFCTTQSLPSKPQVRTLDVSQAATTLESILAIWPSRVNSESSSDSPEATIKKGSIFNRCPSESQC